MKVILARTTEWPMYFRRKTSSGRVYLQIVESRREGDQVRQQVIATLGRCSAPRLVPPPASPCGPPASRYPRQCATSTPTETSSQQSANVVPSRRRGTDT